MIKFVNVKDEAPLIFLIEKYHQAVNANQKNIEALAISSFNKDLNEVDSRFVNIKFINKDKFIFFSNYNSPKSIAFESHKQISGLFFWASINTQIRLKAKVKKTSAKFNEQYFKNRSPEKNALAISSKQSRSILSYEDVLQDYNKVHAKNNLSECPEYWGGYSFIPYYFEFWEGHESRINKREVFYKTDGIWKHSFLQP
jgi:pyridoxamine 5'-phosphate oxidase